MTTNDYSREQRLRKQAELQSLHINLASLRKQEATYIEAFAVVPDLLVNQIIEIRREIRHVENELLALHVESLQIPAREFYWQAFEAELANDFERALKLYKNASRHPYPDAEAAIQSIRHQMRTVKEKHGLVWWPSRVNESRPRWLIGVAMLAVLVLVMAFICNNLIFSPPTEVVVVEPTATITTTTTPSIILIEPNTPTPFPTNTPTTTPTYTPTPTPTKTPRPTATPTETVTPAPTLRPAPRIIGPKDGLVWEAGAVVFEFAHQGFKGDELYCINGLRGFDSNNAENWSYPPIGNKIPYIPVEANVFRVAKVQDIKCIVWSASIGKGSCDNIISKNTEERVIGMPRPCDLKSIRGK